MWCPSCGAEYRPGFTHCPDCDVDLVSEPPPEPESEGDAIGGFVDPDLGPSPVEVFVGPVVEAEMMRAVLEGSGIPCAASGSGMQGAYPGLFPHRLAVASENAERAVEIIEAARTGELDLDAAPEESPPPPPPAPAGRLVPIFSGELEDGEEVQALLARRNIPSALVESNDEEIEVDVVVAAEKVQVSLAILEAEEEGSLLLEPDDPEYEEGVDVDAVDAAEAPGEIDRERPPGNSDGPISEVKSWWRRRPKS